MMDVASQNDQSAQGAGTIRDVSVPRGPTPQGPDQQPETVEGDDELAAQSMGTGGLVGDERSSSPLTVA